MNKFFVLFILFASIVSCKVNPTDKHTGDTGEHKTTDGKASATVKKLDTLILEGETHFKSLRQVTFGGDNAEAYWSFDDTKLVFQAKMKLGTHLVTKSTSQILIRFGRKARFPN